MLDITDTFTKTMNMNTRKYYDDYYNSNIEVSIDGETPGKVTITCENSSKENTWLSLGKEDVVNLIEYLTELSKQL